jgi:hypothetical protein
MPNPRKATLVLTAAMAMFAIAGCGGPAAEPSGAEAEPHHEGIAAELDGLQYNIYLTRQLNLEDTEDSGYTTLDPPPPGKTYYASFFSVCNPPEGEEAHTTATQMEVTDSQGNVFQPIDISDSQFAYESTELEPGDCMPTKGSLTDMAPAGGALVVFELPVATTENRPLDLKITSPETPATGEPHTLTFTLDL